MQSSENRKAYARRLLRLLLVVSPLFALGSWLGIYGGGSGPPDMPTPFDPATAPPVHSIDTAGHIDENAVLAAIGRAGRIELQGGTAWHTRLEVTRLPIEEAIAQYSSKAAADGLTPDTLLQSAFADLDSETEFLAYRTNGRLRIVLIGQAPDADSSGLPVTIFDGTFASNGK